MTGVDTVLVQPVIHRSDLSRAVRSFRRQESGASLPEVMVAVLVNAISVSLIAATILAFITLQSAFAGNAESARESSVAELRWRSDVREASKIAVADSTSVTFSVAGSDGTCLERNWLLLAGSARSSLSIVTRAYPGAPSAAGCAGAPGQADTVTVIADAAAGNAFAFTNAGGRAVTYSAGMPTLDQSATKPGGVSDADWAATAAAKLTLATRTRATTNRPSPLSVTQTVATNAGIVQTTDAPTHYVAP